MHTKHSVEAASTAVRPQLRDDLQGLQGIAIALVVICHVWFGRVSGGIDVVLVLSGFFFGARLLRLSAEGAGTLAPVRELARLGRRLLPTLVVVLASCGALTLLIQPRTRWETFADQALSSLLFVQNWQLEHAAGDYAQAGEAVTPLQHLWAVSVLGQVLVALLVAVWLIGLVVPQRLRRRTIVVAALVAAVASFGYAAVIHDADAAGGFYDSFARAWEVLAGVALAGVVSAGLAWPRWWRGAAAVVGLAVILSVGAVIDGAREFPGPLALLPVAGTCLLICSGAGASTAALPGPNRLLSVAPVATLGAMAYALYLWHWPLLIFWLAYRVDDRAGLSDGLLIIVASVALAYATTRWVERPLRLAPEAAGPHRIPVLALGTAVLLLAAAVAAGSIGWRQHVNAVRAHGSELLALSPIDYPGARVLAEQRKVAKLPFRPTVLEASEDLPATIADGCISDFGNAGVTKCDYGDLRAARTIALVGGSHSEHWLEALNLLGRQHGFKVVTYLKMGCPMTTDELPRVSVSNDPYPGCREWTEAALASLVADQPDYVFTTTTRPHPDTPGDFVPDSYLGIWDVFADNGLGVLGVRDTPWMYRDGMLFSPVDCLADGGDAESCGLPRSEALADYNPTMDYLDRYPGIVPIDLSDAVCGPTLCRAVEGNVLVYHDAHHLTASYVRTLTDELGRQLSDAIGWW
jgi:peptidoglycan/LPS O-acetylase OafA/YrhL